MAIRTKKVTLTPANIYALFAAPQIVLPAPSSGYVNNIVGLSLSMEYNSAAYTTASAFQFGKTAGGVVVVAEDTYCLPATADVNVPVFKGNTSQLPFTTEADFYITTNAAAADGDSDVNVYVIYEEKLLDT